MNISLTVKETQILKNLIREKLYASIDDESIFSQNNEYPALFKIFVKISKAEDEWTEKMAYTE